MSKKKINVIAPTIDSSGLQISNTKKIRVCAYARVSTAQDEQLNSLESQRQYYLLTSTKIQTGNLSIYIMMKEYQV